VPSAPPPDPSSRAARAPANAEVGRFFVELRWAIGVPTRQLAERLATSESVIRALEAGRIADLPAWPETVRIVSDYAALARIDTRPVLHVIAGALAANQAPQQRTSAPVAARAPVSTPQPARGSESSYLRLRAGISRLIPARAA